MEKFCKCFNFQISKDGNKGNYFPANVDDTLLNFYNTYSTHFLYVQIKNNKEKKCKCNEKNHQSINNYLEKDILNLKKEIEKKDNEIKNQKNYNCKLENDFKQQSQKINKLEITINDLNQNLKKYEIEKQSKLNEISELKKSIELLNEEKSSLEKQNKLQEDEIKNLKIEVEKLQYSENILKLAVNQDIDTLNAIQKLGIGNELKPKFNTISIDQSSNSIIENKNYELSEELKNFNKNFEDFYDIIINIKSIKDINKGWEIKSNERGKKQYFEKKNEPILKIGVIGNADKGKSFLLSKISKIDLLSGTSISTEGLSIKYPELEKYENRKIALLDSAGLETPVLKETDDENKNPNEKELLFKEKSREKLITELFLQNYIIYNSDILLIVVGKFTYSEQKLLNKIKTEIHRAKINKPLYIIHNLFTFFSIKQVEEHINEYLLKSATFDLEKGHKISTNIKIKNGTYYYEKNSSPNIFHLIFANEGSEAGQFYNKFTLEFIENCFQNVTDLKPFDVIETVKERFIEISKEIIEKNEKNDFNKESFDETDSEKLIKLKDNHDIILKKCFIDELGFSNLKVYGFEPRYSYYKTDKSMVIKLECPGKCSLNPKIDRLGEYTIIKLEGEKKKDVEEETIEKKGDYREYGKFCVDIPLKSQDYLISYEKPSLIGKNGILTITYKLEIQEENDTYDFGDS